MRWARCTTCGAKHGKARGSTECRECRGWHYCACCRKKLPNSAFYKHKHSKIASRCKPCFLAGKRKRVRDTAAKLVERRTTTTKHETRQQITAAYDIPEHDEPLLDRVLEAVRLHRPASKSRGARPDHPTPLEVLEQAGRGFDLTLTEAALELYRLEMQQERAA